VFSLECRASSVAVSLSLYNIPRRLIDLNLFNNVLRRSIDLNHDLMSGWVWMGLNGRLRLFKAAKAAAAWEAGGEGETGDTSSISQ
jgi:hypothetical protein